MRSSGFGYAVAMTTGRSGAYAESIASVSRPFVVGISRSSVTAVIEPERSAKMWIASDPSLASRVWRPALVRRRTKPRRTASSSSITRIVSRGFAGPVGMSALTGRAPAGREAVWKTRSGFARAVAYPTLGRRCAHRKTANVFAPPNLRPGQIANGGNPPAKQMGRFGSKRPTPAPDLGYGFPRPGFWSLLLARPRSTSVG